MALISQNIDVYAGDSKLLQVTVTDEAGNALDISGCTIKWAIVRGRTKMVEKISPNNITLDDPSNGVYSIKVVPNDTVDLPPGTYYHESIVIDVFGNVTTVFKGNLKVLPSYLQ